MKTSHREFTVTNMAATGQYFSSLQAHKKAGHTRQWLVNRGLGGGFRSKFGCFLSGAIINKDVISNFVKDLCLDISFLFSFFLG